MKCPDLIRIVHCSAKNTKEAIYDVSIEVDRLVGPNKENHETALIVLDQSFVQDFRDFVRLSWELQEEAIGDKYMGVLQLVLFHPLAVHQTYGEVDPSVESASDYTIRSPFPTIHLLREVDLMRAVKGGYPDLESLPSRNKLKMDRQGQELCQQRLDDCLMPKGAELP